MTKKASIGGTALYPKISLKPNQPTTAYDPCCGTGGFLIENPKKRKPQKGKKHTLKAK